LGNLGYRGKPFQMCTGVWRCAQCDQGSTVFNDSWLAAVSTFSGNQIPPCTTTLATKELYKLLSMSESNILESPSLTLITGYISGTQNTSRCGPDSPATIMLRFYLDESDTDSYSDCPPSCRSCWNRARSNAQQTTVDHAPLSVEKTAYSLRRSILQPRFRFLGRGKPNTPEITEANHVSDVQFQRKKVVQRQIGNLINTVQEVHPSGVHSGQRNCGNCDHASSCADSSDTSTEHRKRTSKFYPRFSMSMPHLIKRARPERLERPHAKDESIQSPRTVRYRSSSPRIDRTYANLRARHPYGVQVARPTSILSIGSYGSWPSLSAPSNHSSPPTLFTPSDDSSPSFIMETMTSGDAILGDTVPLPQKSGADNTREDVAGTKAVNYSNTLASLDSAWHKQILPPVNRKHRQPHRSRSDMSLGSHYVPFRSLDSFRPQRYQGVTIPPPIPPWPSAQQTPVKESRCERSRYRTNKSRPYSQLYPVSVDSLKRPSTPSYRHNVPIGQRKAVESPGAHSPQSQWQLYRNVPRLHKHNPLLNRPVKAPRGSRAQKLTGDSTYIWKSRLSPLPERVDRTFGDAVQGSGRQSTGIDDGLAQEKKGRSIAVPESPLRRRHTYFEGRRCCSTETPVGFMTGLPHLER